MLHLVYPTNHWKMYDGPIDRLENEFLAGKGGMQTEITQYISWISREGWSWLPEKKKIVALVLTLCGFVPRGNHAALHSNSNAGKRNVWSISQTLHSTRCVNVCVCLSLTPSRRSDPKRRRTVCFPLKTSFRESDFFWSSAQFACVLIMTSFGESEMFLPFYHTRQDSHAKSLKAQGMHRVFRRGRHSPAVDLNAAVRWGKITSVLLTNQ